MDEATSTTTGTLGPYASCGKFAGELHLQTGQDELNELLNTGVTSAPRWHHLVLVRIPVTIGITKIELIRNDAVMDRERENQWLMAPGLLGDQFQKLADVALVPF